MPLADYERARIERELHRHRSFIPTMVREFLSWEEMAAIEVSAPDLPGILVDVGTSRMYPFGEQLAHVAGYVAPPTEADVADDPALALPGIRVGRAGVEKQHDRDLRGSAGAVQLEVNALGRVIRELDRQEGVAGEDVGLTIDVALQQAVLGRLGDECASCVVLDCRNGEVLAMGTNPSFDPALFNAGVTQAQWTEWAQDKRTRCSIAPRPACTRLARHSRWQWRWPGWSRGSSRLAMPSIVRGISISAMRGFTAGDRVATARSICAAD